MLEVLNHGRKTRAHVPIYVYSHVDAHLQALSGQLGINLTDPESDSAKNLLKEFASVFPFVSEVSEDGGSGFVITDIFVFDDDPCNVVFFDSTEQRVVKTVKLPNPVAGILITRVFDYFAQALIVTSDNDNIMGLHVVKLSKSNKNEIIVRKYQLDCVIGNSGDPISNIKAESVNVSNYYVDKTYTNSFDYWLTASSNKFILTNSMIGVCATHILKHKNFDESIIMLNQTRADFRKGKNVPDPGILENASTNHVHTISYTVGSKKLLYKSCVSGCAVLIDNRKLVFLQNKRATSAGQQGNWNPQCLVSFEMPGALDFCFNDSRLYLAVNDNQIYAYDNFYDFYLSCYRHSKVQEMAHKQPGKAYGEPYGYKGCLDDACSFLMPAPSYVMSMADMFQDDQQVYMVDVFFNGSKEILTFCTRSAAKGNSFYVMSEGKVVFKKVFKHKIKQVDGIANGYEASCESAAGSRQKNFKLSVRMLFTVELESGSLVRFEVDTDSKAVSDMPTVTSGNGSGRFLDF